MARKKREDPSASAPVTPSSTPAAGLRERVIAHVSKATNKPPEALNDELILTAQPGKPGLEAIGVWSLMEALEAEFGVHGKLTEVNKIKLLRVADVVAEVQRVVGS